MRAGLGSVDELHREYGHELDERGARSIQILHGVLNAAYLHILGLHDAYLAYLVLFGCLPRMVHCS